MDELLRFLAGAVISARRRSRRRRRALHRTFHRLSLLLTLPRQFAPRIFRFSRCLFSAPTESAANAIPARCASVRARRRRQKLVENRFSVGARTRLQRCEKRFVRCKHNLSHYIAFTLFGRKIFSPTTEERSSGRSRANERRVLSTASGARP